MDTNHDDHGGAASQKNDKFLIPFRTAYSRYMFGDWHASEDDRLRALYEQLRSWQEAECLSESGSDHLLYGGVLETNRGMVSLAIKQWNSDFFRELAKAMDLAKPSKLEPLRFVFLATEKLLARRELSDIRKGDVQLLAQRWWAIERLIVSGGYSDQKRQHELRKAITDEASPPIEKEISAEIRTLTTQDWTELFKKAGLKDLWERPGGRPSKRLKQV